jgi:ADP-ribosylglycohydrolase
LGRFIIFRQRAAEILRGSRQLSVEVVFMVFSIRRGYRFHPRHICFLLMFVTEPACRPRDGWRLMAMPEMQDHEDRIVGTLLGLVAGDRIGGPVRMAILVAESLRERGDFDVSDIGCRYLRWWREGAFDTGPTVARVLSFADTGMPFAQASLQANLEAEGMTAGCNPAHRSVPFATCASIPDSSLAQAATSEALLTHRHPLAGDVAAAVNCLCRALIRGAPWSVAVKVAAEGRSPETRHALALQAAPKLSRNGFAPDVLGAAIHFVHESASFANALTRSIAFAGPPNYCLVLVGSISGARWGAGQIDAAWLRHHDVLVPRLTSIARALASGCPAIGAA